MYECILYILLVSISSLYFKLYQDEALISLSGRRGQTLALSWIKTRVFFEKHIENKHLCRTDKNFHYLCKSNIAVINLIVGSRNMIEVL